MGRKAPSLRDGQCKTHIDDDEEDPKLTQSPAATQPQPPTQALLTRSSPKATNPTTRTGNSLLSVPVAPLGLAAPEPHASIPRTRSASDLRVRQRNPRARVPILLVSPCMMCTITSLMTFRLAQMRILPRCWRRMGFRVGLRRLEMRRWCRVVEMT
jgi:hypothetical protein